MTRAFELEPQGPFDLAHQAQFFGGFVAPAEEPDAIAMAFPVEGWSESAAVVMRQRGGAVAGEVHGAREPERAWRQALAVLSLDVDGRGYPAVGERDPVIGALQQRYRFVRPVLFHSPYEAAANFVIGQRISMRQARAIRQRLGEEHGDAVRVGGQLLHAFPRPEALARVTAARGLTPEKIARLHGIAAAAAEGLLDRERLRAMAADGPDEALAALRELRGVGAFSAQGILHRGAGLVDALTDDDVTPQAVARAYGRAVDRPGIAAIAEAWRPFRMWALVQLHVWFRREEGGPKRPRRRN